MSFDSNSRPGLIFDPDYVNPNGGPNGIFRLAVSGADSSGGGSQQIDQNTADIGLLQKQIADLQSELQSGGEEVTLNIPFLDSGVWPYGSTIPVYDFDGIAQLTLTLPDIDDAIISTSDNVTASLEITPSVTNYVTFNNSATGLGVVNADSHPSPEQIEMMADVKNGEDSNAGGTVGFSTGTRPVIELINIGDKYFISCELWTTNEIHAIDITMDVTRVSSANTRQVMRVSIKHARRYMTAPFIIQAQMTGPSVIGERQFDFGVSGSGNGDLIILRDSIMNGISAAVSGSNTIGSIGPTFAVFINGSQVTTIDMDGFTSPVINNSVSTDIYPVKAGDRLHIETIQANSDIENVVIAISGQSIS